MRTFYFTNWVVDHFNSLLNWVIMAVIVNYFKKKDLISICNIRILFMIS